MLFFRINVCYSCYHYQHTVPSWTFMVIQASFCHSKGDCMVEHSMGIAILLWNNTYIETTVCILGSEGTLKPKQIKRALVVLSYNLNWLIDGLDEALRSKVFSKKFKLGESARECYGNVWHSLLAERVTTRRIDRVTTRRKVVWTSVKKVNE